MGDGGAMNASVKVGPDLAMFREDLDALTRNVVNLIDHERRSDEHRPERRRRG